MADPKIDSLFSILSREDNSEDSEYTDIVHYNATGWTCPFLSFLPYTLQTSGTHLIIKTLVKHGLKQQRDL